MQTSMQTWEPWTSGHWLQSPPAQVLAARALSGGLTQRRGFVGPSTTQALQAMPHAFPPAPPEQGWGSRRTRSPWLLIGLLSLESLKRAAGTFILQGSVFKAKV